MTLLKPLALTALLAGFTINIALATPPADISRPTANEGWCGAEFISSNKSKKTSNYDDRANQLQYAANSQYCNWTQQPNDTSTSKAHDTLISWSEACANAKDSTKDKKTCDENYGYLFKLIPYPNGITAADEVTANQITADNAAATAAAAKAKQAAGQQCETTTPGTKTNCGCWTMFQPTLNVTTSVADFAAGETQPFVAALKTWIPGPGSTAVGQCGSDTSNSCPQRAALINARACCKLVNNNNVCTDSTGKPL